MEVDNILKKAVFLDRDGVIIVDTNLITRADQIKVIKGIPEAMTRLKLAGFLLIIISNQPVVARGLISEDEVKVLNNKIENIILKSGEPQFDGFYFCPHHPNANLENYRILCDCRKPSPGLLLKATSEKGIDIKKSFMVGDRITDIIAGKKAGCTTIQVLSGMHSSEPIQTSDAIDLSIKPDLICADLSEAASWILGDA